MAKLSRKFYETFGNDLVSCLNSIEANYRSELRDLFDTQFGRFEAKAEQRLGEAVAELRSEIADFRLALASQRADMLKWMFLFWSGTVPPLAGLMVALATV